MSNYMKYKYNFLAMKLGDIIIWDLISDAYIVDSVINWKPRRIVI